MQKKANDLFNHNVDPIGMAMGLVAAAKLSESKLSDTERARRKQEREDARNERRRQANIIHGICPTCDGKLVRGKKNKHNGYKREWTCKACKEVFSL